MQDNGTFLFIPQELVRDPECSHMDVAVWCYALIVVHSYYKDKELVQPSQIAFHMKGGCDYSQNTVTSISESLRNLLQMGYLKGEQVDRNRYIITKDSFATSRFHYFVKIMLTDLCRIMTENLRPYSVLRYYLLILSTIDYKTNCGTWRLDTIGEVLDQNETTVSRNLMILEKMELIYVYRGVRSSNTYGRIEDKEAVIKMGRSRGNDGRITKASNIKRRMTQMYNRVKAGHMYDPVIMEEIRDYCQRKNDETGENFYDLSIFSVDFARDAS